MQWNDGPHAGFCTQDIVPWMRVNENVTAVDVQAQQTTPESVLSFWKHLFALRRRHKELIVYGRYDLAEVDNEQSFVFMKSASDNARCFTVANTSGDTIPFSVSVLGTTKPLGTIVENMPKTGEGCLRGYEARVYMEVV